MEKYIAHKRFKGKGLSGCVNIPAQSVLWCHAGVLCYGGKPVCFKTSEVAHQHFAADGDGKGMRRGKLTHAIQKTLAKRDAEHQTRWDKVWADPICQPYRREDYTDYWLWDHAFFCADIAALQYIAELIGAREAD